MNGQNVGHKARAPVNGLLLLNKPAGITSNQALQKVKRLLQAKKAGHTGSLDPATKVCAFLLEADKTYRVTAKLGTSTDTGDADGSVTGTADVPTVGRQEWEQILSSFLGESEQVPPMYSALKKDGKRLYELARKGEVVERKPRRIRIDEICLLESHKDRLVFRVRCSKGTYVRTLVEDVAAAAGTIGHTASLHRETVGSFRAEDMLDLPGAECVASEGPEALRERLMPVDAALANWPEQHLTGEFAERFVSGQAVQTGVRGCGYVRIYGDGERFLGIGEFTRDGRVAPRRIFHPSP